MTRSAAALLVAALATFCGLSHGADQHAGRSAQPTSTPAPDTVSWAALTPAQNAALAPLRSDWNTLDATHQQKWLQMAQRMAAMPAVERRRIQQRMAQWSQLSPEKRGQARQRFLEARQLPSPQRHARWLEYQALSDEQKGRLAAQARATYAADRAPGAGGLRQGFYAPAGKPSTPDLPQGAKPRATSAPVLQAKPGATTRALTTPSAPPVHHQPGMPKIVATDGFVDPATLLPKRGAQGAAVRSALTVDKPSGKPSKKP